MEQLPAFSIEEAVLHIEADLLDQYFRIFRPVDQIVQIARINVKLGQ